MPPDSYPLYLVSPAGEWEQLMPTLKAFKEAYSKTTKTSGYRIWFKDAFYQWSCGFCPLALPKFLNIPDSNCKPQDCVDLWKECVK